MGLAYAAKARRNTTLSILQQLRRVGTRRKAGAAFRTRHQCGGTCSRLISVMGTMSVSSISF